MFLLSLILMLLIFIFSFNIIENIMYKYNNKLEIECGMFTFLNKNSSSLNYMLFILIFLIFDLEIILFFSILFKNINMFYLIFLILILLSLILELFEMTLKWND